MLRRSIASSAPSLAVLSRVRSSRPYSQAASSIGSTAMISNSAGRVRPADQVCALAELAPSTAHDTIVHITRVARMLTALLGEAHPAAAASGAAWETAA